MDRNSQNTNNAALIKDCLIIVLIAVAGATISISVFLRLFNVSKQSILNMCNANTITMSQDIEHYLSIPKDAILLTSKSVEEMLADGMTNKEINEFLINGTDTFSSVVDSNPTGIYGYINGEYLDSSGWIPPEGFNPVERPWYIDAKKANGEVAFVEPYLNVQTNTLMMSVSKLLDDKESVLSMDIYLDGIQKIDEEMLENEKLESALVIDSGGKIVSHSDKDEIGKNYSNDGIALHKKIYDGILSQKENNIFSVSDDGARKLVFSRHITNEWYSVFVYDESKLYSSIVFIHIHSIVVLSIVFFAFLLAFSLFRRRHKETRQLQSELAAIADIYLSLSILDLKDLKLNKMWVSERLSEILSSGNFSLTRVDEIVKAIAVESSRNMLEQFMDFSTIAERLSNTRSISHDFIDIDNHWTRMHFIAADWDKEGTLHHVIWATESIDEDKKRQEDLRRRSETDGLTGILNRRGGEDKIFDALEEGKCGMLLLLDADHFKFVNDNYGHDVGDKVIKGIADCLIETFRESDVVFRLGGDEFSVFASGVDTVDIGRLVAERLFANVNKFDLPELKDWKLSVSVGATFCCPDNTFSFDKLYKQADSAMYESKQKNGNFITFY